MWQLGHKESWVLKNWCFQIVVLEETLESPLDCNEIQPGNPKGNQPWIFIWRTDAEAEAPLLWPPDTKSQLIGKDPDAGKDWRQQRMRWLDSITDWMYMNVNELREIVEDRGAWHAAVYGVTKSQTRLSDWTTTTKLGGGCRNSEDSAIPLLGIYPKELKQDIDACMPMSLYTINYSPKAEKPKWPSDW